MTRQSIREYAWAIRVRYRQSNKEGKTKILDEFTQTTGLHRKAAIRLLNKDPQLNGREKRCLQALIQWFSTRAPQSGNLAFLQERFRS